ncbi:MAG: ribosome silencing factor [Clostridia bacterium]|nr:ribosome silencing factor [Clostridia bacterium]
MQAFDKVKVAVKALDSKKGTDIEVIQIDSVSSLGDYLIIVTGNSTTQVRALAEEAEYKLEQAGAAPDHVEGRASGWILLDCNDVMIHVFTPQQREFYALGHLWQDGQPLDISTFLTEGEDA